MIPWTLHSIMTSERSEFAQTYKNERPTFSRMNESDKPCRPDMAGVAGDADGAVYIGIWA